MHLYTKSYTLRTFLSIYADIRRYFVHFFEDIPHTSPLFTSTTSTRIEGNIVSFERGKQ